MIDIQNLSFSYKKQPVLSHISLRFESGRIYGLLGENGVGKTTLLKLIAGLLSPQEGSCRVDDYTSFDREPDMLRRVLFLPDEVQLPFDATPKRYVRELAPFYPHYSEERFLKLMEELKVEPERRFREMSFGQQKKSLIAASLAMGTEYVLLDEPTNGLDIPSKADLRRLLSQCADTDSAIIISTHQVKDVENLIDPLIILSQNAVLLHATNEEICRRLLFAYADQELPGALYSERMPGGVLNVVENTTGEESQVQVEALFNAVLRNPERIRQLFQ